MRRLVTRFTPIVSSQGSINASTALCERQPLKARLASEEPIHRTIQPLPFRKILRAASFSRDLKKSHIALAAPRAGNINTVPGIPGADFKKDGDRSMLCSLEILSTPTADTGTALMLNFDHRRYLIGHVAEGTQRAAVQRKTGLAKVSDIFLTGTVRWKNVGGILGMLLTIADSVGAAKESVNRSISAKKESRKSRGLSPVPNGQRQDKTRQDNDTWLNIHGGRNITHTLATARRFVFRKGMPIHTQEFRPGDDVLKEGGEPTWKDDTLKVWAMVLEPERTETSSPLKRKYEEDEPVVTATDGNPMTAAEQEDADDQVRKGVLADMFGSNWRLDALVTKRLSEVHLPAKIFVRNARGKVEEYKGPMIGEDVDVEDIEVMVRNPWPGALVENIPRTTPSQTSTCYIMKTYPVRGKFNPQAAQALGVPSQQFKVLTQGNNYTTEDGVVVTPEQVMAAASPGQGFAVIDLPDKTYVDALVKRQEWSNKTIMAGINNVVWILGSGVFEHPRLQTFMKEHTELKHIVASPDTCSDHLALESAATMAIKLHIVDGERFPIPAFSNETPVPRTEPSFYEPARTGKKIILSPRLEEKNEGIVPYLDTIKLVQELRQPGPLSKLAGQARKTVTDKAYLEELDRRQVDLPGKDVEVFTFGTGSSLPSKYRNVSATLVRVPEHGSYLLDCGENTLGQWKRVFGSQSTEVLRDLKMIWISHLHADHHLGTVSVIRAWHEATKDDPSTKDTKLMIASDIAMLDWLREYSGVEDFGYSRLETISIDPRLTDPNKSPLNRVSITSGSFYRVPKHKQASLGLASIETCLVEHCHKAMAVALTFPTGFKVAYSGDCRPAAQFAQIGRGATLLIHEATFDDELRGDALAKKHCTTSEALEVGRKMGAKRILLTHFSQRYQKMPILVEGDDQVVCVAFDYMRVKVGDIAKMEALRPVLARLLGEVAEDADAEADDEGDVEGVAEGL